MSFKLMLSLEEFNGFNPVYPLEVPKYLATEIGLSLEDYYNRAMSCTQRLINSYMQNVLANNDWDIYKFDIQTREQIKYILFKEMEYLHQNQIWFKKSNSISYSTSGQQSFTFSPDADNLNESHIPHYVKIEINNTGLIKKATAYKIEQYDYIQKNNEFKDRVLVPDVAWGDKANNIVAINGKNDSLENFIKYLYARYVSIESHDYQKLLELSNIFALNESSVLTRRKLTSNTYFSNKTENDFAQVKDIIETFYISNNALSQVILQVSELSNNVNDLQSSKLDANEFNKAISGKANTNLSNVNLGRQNIPKFMQISTNGEIILKDTDGSLNPIIWTPEYDFIVGDFASVVISPKTSAANPKVRIFCCLENNTNKNPLQYPKLWAEYEINYEVIDSISKQEAERLFVQKQNGQLLGDLDANGFNINNPGNLITKEQLDDSVIANNKLWSSTKIVQYINEYAPTNPGDKPNAPSYKNTDNNIEIDNISNIINLKDSITLDSLLFKNKLNNESSAEFNEQGIDTNSNYFYFKIKAANEKIEYDKITYLPDGPSFNPKNFSRLIKYFNVDNQRLENFDLVQDLYKLIKLIGANEITNAKVDSLEDAYNNLIEKLRTFRPFKEAGNYNPDNTYQQNEWVYKDGDIYVSRIDDNNEPLANNDAWYHWDLQISLDHLATIEKLNELKLELIELITTNNVDITNLTEKVDRLQQTKQDKMIAGNNCEITPNNQINVLIPETIIPTAFRKGEIRFFDTQENVDEIIQKYKLIQDNDFSYLENDRFLMTMNINKDTPAEQIKGGRNFIVRENLPPVNLSHSHGYQFGGGSGGWQGLRDGYNGNRGSFKVHTEREEIILNGGVEQTEFKPKYHGVIGIRFLKDIKEVQSETI